MKDGGEEYHGTSLSYNFKSQKGRINIANTRMDQGYYHGEEIKKVDSDVLFVENGRYTTCEDDDPHYYFQSPKMKVIVRDQIIAEPAYLYIEDVPVFWLPFGVFPGHGGRRSGIITPAIVEDPTHGRLLHHLGYYWAISDYMDMNARTDLYTKGSWAIMSDYRYALRYYFSGGFSGEYRKMITGESSDPNHTVDESYQFKVLHNQEIDPTMHANVNFTFASNNSYINTIERDQALNQDITSNATLSKFWEGTPNSISLNLSRNQNLQTGNISEVLPQFGFNHAQSYPFRSGKSTDASNLSWYEEIGMTYSANLANARSKTTESIMGIHSTIGGVDTVLSQDAYGRTTTQSIAQSLVFTIAPRVGNFSVVPQLSYQDSRSFSQSTKPSLSTDSSGIVYGDADAASRTGTLSTGVGISTRLYGLMNPGFFGIAAFRHTLTPSLSFTYNKQIVGDNFAPKQMLAALSVGNIFEMKTEQANPDKEPDKIQLLNLNAGVSYNFSADSLRFSPIALGYRTAFGKALSVDGTADFDLYKLEQTGYETYTRVNKFLLNEEGRLARLTSFSIALSTQLVGAKSTRKPTGGEVVDTTARRQSITNYQGFYKDEEPDFSIPWSISLAYDYSETRVPPFPVRSSSVKGNLDFNLTENWKFSVSGGYDLINQELGYPQIVVSRDLHCWVMDFTWVPVGQYRHYAFEIRVKAPQLRDIKVTKHGSSSGIY
jgi:lipopolysaccharide assembly outer membrane protein LptD (OstA)